MHSIYLIALFVVWFPSLAAQRPERVVRLQALVRRGQALVVHPIRLPHVVKGAHGHSELHDQDSGLQAPPVSRPYCRVENFVVVGELVLGEQGGKW
jgi:hypothetical protein